MKKFLFISGFVFLAGLTTVFAGEPKKMNESPVRSFSRDFSGASVISWQREGDYSKVTFTMNNQVMYAFYSVETSELVGVARNILSDRLPILLMASLKNDFDGYWITNLVEVVRNGETAYYATLENEGKVIQVKSAGFNGWSIENKIKKN
jgi:hypothetical protein